MGKTPGYDAFVLKKYRPEKRWTPYHQLPVHGLQPGMRVYTTGSGGVILYGTVREDPKQPGRAYIRESSSGRKVGVTPDIKGKGVKTLFWVIASLQVVDPLP